MTNQITDSVGSYLMGMVILAFFNSIVAFLLHLILGLPYPLLMGVLAFSITIIPLVGPGAVLDLRDACSRCSRARSRR